MLHLDNRAVLAIIWRRLLVVVLVAVALGVALYFLGRLS